MGALLGRLRYVMMSVGPGLLCPAIPDTSTPGKVPDFFLLPSIEEVANDLR